MYRAWEIWGRRLFYYFMCSSPELAREPTLVWHVIIMKLFRPDFRYPFFSEPPPHLRAVPLTLKNLDDIIV
jgi:hypothetical protein